MIRIHLGEWAVRHPTTRVKILTSQPLKLCYNSHVLFINLFFTCTNRMSCTYFFPIAIVIFSRESISEQERNDGFFSENHDKILINFVWHLRLFSWLYLFTSNICKYSNAHKIIDHWISRIIVGSRIQKIVHVLTHQPFLNHTYL